MKSRIGSWSFPCDLQGLSAISRWLSWYRQLILIVPVPVVDHNRCRFHLLIVVDDPHQHFGWKELRFQYNEWIAFFVDGLKKLPRVPHQVLTARLGRNGCAGAGWRC